MYCNRKNRIESSNYNELVRVGNNLCLSIDNMEGILKNKDCAPRVKKYTLDSKTKDKPTLTKPKFPPP